MDDIYDRIIIGDETFNFRTGKTAFKEELKQHFPSESLAIDQYVDLISDVSSKVPRFFAGQSFPRSIGLMYNKARKLFLPKHFFKSTKDVLESLTSDQKLIGVLTGQWGDYGLPPSESSFIMHAMVAKHYLAGGCYPVGGSWVIADKIIPVIQKSGGEVFTYAGVDKILIENNSAKGVQLKNGDQLFAKQIVSNIGILPTLKHLIPEDSSRSYNFESIEKNINTSSAHLCIYAGFKGTAEQLGLSKTNLWIYPGFDHDKNVKVYKEKPEGNWPLIYISFPSAKDPSWEERYPNKSTVEIVTVGEWKHFEDWANSTWNKRGDSYNNTKERIAQELLAVLFKQLPQLKDALDYYELSTPLSTQWFQWNLQGEIYGIDHTVERFAQNWLHPETPIKNLYLTGSDIVTAGVGGAVMGGVMTTACMLGMRNSWRVMKLIKNG